MKNRRVLETTLTLLGTFNMPKCFCLEAVHTSVYLINRQTSSVIANETPYFRLFHQTPDYLHLRVFDCVCFVHFPAHEQQKLSAKAVQCIFVGYSDTQKGYLCYDSSRH